MKKPAPVKLTPAEQAVLEAWVFAIEHPREPEPEAKPKSEAKR